MSLDLTTKSPITWCPGCPNSAILVSFRTALDELVEEGKLDIENAVALSGIGCHGKITDYVKINTFTSLHGRLIPTMTGIKAGNPELTVFGFSGDGDSYDEGAAHLLHAARRNTDMNLFIHDNQVFALTTGQATPTSPKGFKGKSTPDGSFEEPMNPLLVMLAVGATFVARAYAPDIEQTKNMIKAAVAHKGFTYIDIIQPCITFLDTREDYGKRKYWLDESYSTDDRDVAMDKVQEDGDKLPFGIFYQAEKPTFEQELYKTSDK